LETLDPPLIYASAPEAVAASALSSRFVVVDATSEGAVQDYPARRALPVRPGVRQSPFDPRIVYVWREADPSPDQLDALRARAARVGYLGCADSPVSVSVNRTIDEDMGSPWRPDRSSSFALPVPYIGFLAALDSAYDTWSGGKPMRRSWIRTVRSGYRPPGQTEPPAEPSANVIWLRFGRGVAGRKLLAMTEALRDAVCDHVQRLIPPGAEVPAVLHGHRPGGAEGPQARFLGLPDVGHPHADGRLLGAVVWLPPGTEPDIVQLARSALTQLAHERLIKTGWFDIEVSLYSGQPRPWAANPRRWTRPARRWVSVTPVVHERWTKGTPGLSEVANWCEHADLPAPTAVRFQRHPIPVGGLDLHPEQVFRAGKPRYPYSHMQLEFSAPVPGPVVLGRARQLGLGLMAPAQATGG
jgi:CRISPR-associated protein Csb2